MRWLALAALLALAGCTGPMAASCLVDVIAGYGAMCQ